MSVHLEKTSKRPVVDFDMHLYIFMCVVYNNVQLNSQ